MPDARRILARLLDDGLHLPEVKLPTLAAVQLRASFLHAQAR